MTQTILAAAAIAVAAITLSSADGQAQRVADRGQLVKGSGKIEHKLDLRRVAPTIARKRLVRQSRPRG